MNQPQAKVCRICGQDCSGRGRIRDPKGRYTCKACLGMEELPGSVPQQGAAVAAEPDVMPIDQSPVVPAARPFEPALAADDDGPIPIAVEPDEAEARTRPRGCPACRRTVPAGAVICVLCGYDFRKGFQPGRGAGAGVIRPGVLTCPTCGYDLKGLKSPRCPECGEIASTAAVKDAFKKRTVEQQWRFMYVLPWALLGGGLVLSCLVLSATGRMAEIPWYMMMFGGQVVVGFIVYIICAMAWVGMDADLPLQGLRLAAATAVVMPLLLVLDRLPGTGFLRLGTLGIALIGLLYAWLIGVLMDVDFDDAWLMATLMYLAQIGTAVVLYLVFNL